MGQRLQNWIYISCSEIGLMYVNVNAPL